MDALVQSGKIRYWGASNHSAARIREFAALSTRPDQAPIAGLEEYYTIAGASLSDTGQHRVQQLEREMFPVVRAAGLGLLAYSPLDAGYLAPGRTVEPGSPPGKTGAGARRGSVRSAGEPRRRMCGLGTDSSGSDQRARRRRKSRARGRAPRRDPPRALGRRAGRAECGQRRLPPGNIRRRPGAYERRAGQSDRRRARPRLECRHRPLPARSRVRPDRSLAPLVSRPRTTRSIAGPSALCG